MKIGIFSNELKDTGNTEALKLSEIIRGRGVEVFLFNNSDRPYLSSIIEETAIEMLAVLGGDGTILGVVSASARNRVPILGINMGNVGFLTEIEQGEEVTSFIDAFQKGEYTIDKRTLLKVIDRNKSHLALNEALLIRNGDCCVTTIDVLIDGNFLDRYVGDGVIISTPTGSTAYSLSAGGPILSPDIEAFIINPICPHSLHNRPIVISDKHTLTLKLRSERVNAKLTVDGKVVEIIENHEEVTIKKSEITAQFLRFSDINFYNKLLLKMNYWSNTRLIKE